MSPQPASYRNLILLLSRSCRARCPDCNVHPEMDRGERLSADIIDGIITPITRQTIRGCVVWTGGEPLATPEPLIQGLHRAHGLGFHSEVLTGGVLPSREVKPILAQLKPYRDRLSLRLSVDGAHLRHNPLDSLLELCEAILAADLRLTFTFRSADPFESDELTELKKRLITMVQAHSPNQQAPPTSFTSCPTCPS